MASNRRITLSIRTKLLLVTSTLLIIPWIGSKYIQEMDAYLRHGQEQALLDRAQIVAALLHERPEFFKGQADVSQTARTVRHLYVRPLQTPIQLDGYAEDWRPYKDRMQNFSHEQILFQEDENQSPSLSFRHQVGSYKHYLYAIFQVTDNHIVYRRPSSLQLMQSDHLQIAMLDREGEFKRYVITTLSPGWVNAHRIPNPGDVGTTGPEVRIKGEWQETANGYIIEIRIPLSMIGAKLAFAIADVDDPQHRTITSLIGTAGVDDPETLGTIVVPSPEVEKLLKQLERRSSRTWVIDNKYRVIGIAGNLVEGLNASEYGINGDEQERPLFAGLLQLFYQWILEQPASEFQDDLSSASRLGGKEVVAALAGQPATRWRKTPDERVSILTATYPVRSGDQVVGAVAIEETSNNIVILQNRAMEILINLSLLAFTITSVVLLVFASRLSVRVRRLRDEAESAIGSDGRVQGTMSNSNAGDEIGDLSRSFSGMLSRLSEYNRYLETMASKLTHELRTPITVVRSSLENLDPTKLDAESQTFTQRALDGIERLSGILNRMSEATRLEQTLQQENKSVFDLKQVISGCVEGYRLAHPQQIFELQLDTASQTVAYMIQGVPDLIAQMLDKLVNNAIDFGADKPILIRLESIQDSVKLSVLDQGPGLPDEMQGNLFDSMVSLRSERSDEPHLGLGLYIVRLIAAFHQGTVTAENRMDTTGAKFSIIFPLNKN